MRITNQVMMLVAGILIICSAPLTFSCNNSRNENSSDTTATNDSSMNTARVDTVTNKKRKPVVSVKEEATNEKEKITKDKYGIYNRAEVMPQFPGGESALEDYIQTNLHYPQRALDNGKEGVVYVHFAVDENGKVSRATTMNNPFGYGLEEEALRVVNDMPEWTPGTIKGKKVKVYLTLPIHYELQG